MTPLAALLTQRIRLGGPITVAEYMAECLLHPTHGYYTTREAFGVAGDFTTAPEISQMFGELIGLALAQAWLDQGAPSPFTLAEAGPGRGTLMADILRVTARVPGFHDAIKVVLIEASPRLRAVQGERLSAYRAVVWVNEVAELPRQPLFLIANEFFDALPIRQFQRGQDGWRERLVGLRNGALAFGLSDPLPAAPEGAAFHDARPLGIVERCQASGSVMDEIATLVQEFGGLALCIDYGDWWSKGDTLQALRQHRFDDPLAHPGEADLTAHVDFEALAGVRPCHFTTQATFLTRLGIEARAARLAQGLVGAALESHLAALRRLTHPAEMGSLFKVLALTRAGSPLPPGFTPDDARNA